MTTAGRAWMHPGDAERVELEPPDITAYRAGNTGIPYVTSFDSGHPGPHAAIVALTHGNEISGALALDQLLRSDIRPGLGKLSLIFANVAAYAEFDPRRPSASRYIDHDLNRLWGSDACSAVDSTSVEALRVEALRPFIDTVDLLLDLHSMQSEIPALLLAGPSEKGRILSRSLSSAAVIVCDTGHDDGTRLRDFGPFNKPEQPQKSVLAECGQHWKSATARMAIDTAYRFLLALGMIDQATAAAHLLAGTPPDYWVEVTERFVPRNDDAYFIKPFVGMEVIAQRGTVIAYDAMKPVRTPYDDCVLIMPSRQPAAGQTAVRLGRRHRIEEHDDG
ncbi:MAG: succinylglutamate desuccinylase/aspartoacylase family protein [Alphaproteobacteria bacterium]